MNRQGNALASLDRGLDVLELLADRGEASLAELSSALHVSRATMFRTFAVLQERGYVEHVRTERAYRLGPQVAALGARAGSTSVVRLAEPALLELQAATGETVNLALLRGRRIVYAAIAEGAYAMRMAAAVGQEVPGHATALGKAILARLPVSHAQSILGREPYQALTPHTKQRWIDLEPALTAVRARGYAEDHEEAEAYVACMAAPILGSDGYPVGAMSVSALTARMTKGAGRQVAALVREKAGGISRRLGYDPTTEPPSPTDGPRLVPSPMQHRSSNPRPADAIVP
jgi:IclR family acetate operon transcriptional repressor